ncbi:MFS transporter [Nakamurella leprariae]|uniref:MFS transporter n=1 Tax=Nakamurella leprariae TaxID=2803911 RepID=UPI002E2C3A07|nr:MFS transporter [Nakamurella leprariae]
MPTLPTPEPSAPRAGRREWAALAAVTLAVVLLAVDGTVLALAVPSLTASLSPSSTQLLWIGDIYSFALAGLLVTMGNVADRIGRRRLLLLGSVGFGIASAIAAFAPTPELLIAARALLGISGATIMPSTLSIIRNLFADARQRTRAIAVWSAGATAGAAAGPLIGGFLLEHFWWGSVFLINVPVVLVIVAAGIFLIPESRNPDPGRIDLVSVALSMAAVIPVVWFVKQTASDGVSVIGVLVGLVGVISGVLFARRQRRLDHPLLDLTLFRQRAFSGAVAANGLAIFAFVGMIFFFSQYLQLVRDLSPLQAGLVELPATLASILVIGFVGIIAVRLGRGPAIGAGLAVAGIGLAVIAVGEAVPGLAVMIAGLVVVGFGSAVAMTVSTDAVMSAVPKERAGAASAISETAYELGVALGIAVMGSIHAAVYRLRLDLPADADPAVAAGLRDSLAAGRQLVGSDSAGAELLEHGRHAFTVALQATSVAAAVIVLVAAFIAWRTIPADRPTAPVQH